MITLYLNTNLAVKGALAHRPPSTTAKSKWEAGGPDMADGSGKGLLLGFGVLSLFFLAQASVISGSQLAMGIVDCYSHNTFYFLLYWDSLSYGSSC